MRLRVGASIVVALIALVSPADARESVSPTWEYRADDTADEVAVRGSTQGASPERGHRSSAGGGWRLILTFDGDLACDPDQDGVADTSFVYMSPDGEVVEVCRDATPPPPIPRYLAEETAEQMSLPVADIGLSPPEGADHLVNLASWLWVENWAAVTTSATLRGVTVSVTAAPEAVLWDMGAGEPPVQCGAGTRYDPNRAEDEQSTDCSYIYRRSSFGEPDERFRAVATMRWAISWTSSTGESGVLPSVSTQRRFQLRVVEGQAVVTEAR